MITNIAFAVDATLILSSTGAAQKIVGQASPLNPLPAPVILDTAGMFQARYASLHSLEAQSFQHPA